MLKLLGRVRLWNALPNRRRAYFFNVWAGRALSKDRFRARLRTDLTQVFSALQRGDVTAQIAAQLPLTRVADALRLAESGTVAGKIVLACPPPALTVLLTGRLRGLMEASPHHDRHIVQVSAMEGSFSREHKTVRHAHTNMAKASLNMLTRTAAADYAASGIYMNSVDTGWVTDERPHPIKTALREAGFRPPLDVIDGAARIYDPVVRGVSGHPVSGLFLKDYRSVNW